MVARFPTLIGAVMLVIAGLLLFITGIILDVMAKNDRKAFIIDANRFAMMRRGSARKVAHFGSWPSMER